MSSFSDMLLYLRKEHGLSQKELAERTGLTRSAIGMYETGKREPDFETSELLADFFNVNLDTLWGRTPVPRYTLPPSAAIPDGKKPAPDFEDGLSAEQIELIRRFDAAPPALRAAALAVLKSAEGQSKAQGGPSTAG